jgi:hypothetical protein
MSSDFCARLRAAADDLAAMSEDTHSPHDEAIAAIRAAESVCAAVEAFQAAEQAKQAAQRRQPFSEADWKAAIRDIDACLARLLEVDLG